ncbi:MAG: DUF5679 domain-containing protein [archaeon]
MVEGRCMRCKEQKEMKDLKIERTSRGGYIAKGKCKDCNTKMAKILSKDQAEKLKG